MRRQVMCASFITTIVSFCSQAGFALSFCSIVWTECFLGIMSYLHFEILSYWVEPMEFMISRNFVMIFDFQVWRNQVSCEINCYWFSDCYDIREYVCWNMWLWTEGLDGQLIANLYPVDQLLPWQHVTLWLEISWETKKAFCSAAFYKQSVYDGHEFTSWMCFH